MKRFYIKSLQQRMMLFLLIPVACGLIVTGFIGFFYVRKAMLSQWEESALLKLERAAHYINMRLSVPIERVKLLTAASDVMTRQILLDDIRQLPGISELTIDWNIPPENSMRHKSSINHFRHRMMQFHSMMVSKVNKPEFDAVAGHKVVKIVTSLLDNSNNEIGSLVIKLEFDYLMEDISKLGWWQSDMACLVTKNGTYLVHTNMEMRGRQKLGDMGDPIEIELSKAINENKSGTIMGAGHPPDMVAGYHSLSMAPWTIIIYAPGKKVLEPIVRFRIYYLIGSLSLIFFILLLIRTNVGKMVAPIRVLSRSAKHVAAGNYGDPIKTKTDDEIGQLIVSYNSMVKGLKERDFIRNTFGRYMDEDVARDLLKNPDAIRLGGDKREVVTLMSDIRGFTPLSEKLEPEQTIQLLNDYFGHMIQIIKIHRGIIVDFVGDAVLVFFDPTGETMGQTAFRATCCALEMQAEMERFNSEMQSKGLPQFEMGIGMNSGEVIVGNIGSASRVKYGIVGAPVNLTQRIQEKAEGDEILVSESIVRHLNSSVTIDNCIEIDLKGVSAKAKLYSISGINREIENAKLSNMTCTRRD